jgi:hypothetical protein
MRHLSLTAMVIVLVLCGSAFAQQRLIRHSDQNDSCRRFKIRILIPADVDHELPVKEFAGGVDPKMVWNPCAKETQIAIAPTIPPLKNDGFKSAQDRPSFGQSSSLCRWKCLGERLFPRLGTADKHPEPGAVWFAPPRFSLPQVWHRP